MEHTTKQNYSKSTLVLDNKHLSNNTVANKELPTKNTLSIEIHQQKYAL